MNGLLKLGDIPHLPELQMSVELGSFGKNVMCCRDGCPSYAIRVYSGVFFNLQILLVIINLAVFLLQS